MISSHFFYQSPSFLPPNWTLENLETLKLSNLETQKLGNLGTWKPLPPKKILKKAIYVPFGSSASNGKNKEKKRKRKKEEKHQALSR